MLNFYIDESGSFVPADFNGAWSLSAGIIVPNSYLRKCEKILRKLKIKSGYKYNDEIKLKHVNEDNYLEFLKDIFRLELTLYCVATDSGKQTTSEIEFHRDSQANKVEEHKDKMLYPEGKKSVERIANQVRTLSPQLHLQLICQIELISKLFNQGILYYVQRTPAQLNKFRWKIDEKSHGVSNFEKTFRTLVPPLLQTKSLKNPGIHVTGFDYSAMKEYMFTKDNAPTYLSDHYDMDINTEGTINLGKLIWDDFEFVDSKKEVGIQIADLLASGLRRCLRGGFTKNLIIAEALGKLMVQEVKDKYPIKFITLSSEEGVSDNTASTVGKILRKSQKQMIK